jgi:alkylated DNA repair protein (DNA oxidative demethylase)
VQRADRIIGKRTIELEREHALLLAFAGRRVTVVERSEYVDKRPAARRRMATPDPGLLTTSLLSALPRDRTLVQIAPGAIWLRRWLPLDDQRALVAECRAIMDGPAGGYTPTVRGGGKMRVRMTCLGRHWNPLTYSYESTRADHDHAPVAPVPGHWVDLATSLAADAGFTCRPDICLINFYGSDGRMGLHQDKDESAASLESGVPVVSVSLGDAARFLFGGLKRREPVETLLLESGDVFVFGGASRRRYHGVARIMAGTSPPALGLEGRFNLTFRQY